MENPVLCAARAVERFLPNPKARLKEQFHEVCRFKHMAGRTEESYWGWVVRLVRFGLGGSLAGGRQFVSWIHQADFCRAIDWLLEQEDLSGVVNLAAPHPVTNAEFMGTLCKVCRIPIAVSAPLWLLELGAFFLRTETELIIKSRRVVPGRLLTSGFEFQFPLIEDALHDLAQPAKAQHHSRG
jgi:uncharacterized protein